MDILKTYIILLLSLCFGLVFAGCWSSFPSSPEGGLEDDNSSLSLYEKDIVPLKPEDCGQCHQEYYELLRTQGGKHRVDCKNCHVEFHTYRPGRVTYEEVLPKCKNCHEPQHGEELLNCLGCHSQVHSPLNIPARRMLGNNCYICHPAFEKELKTYITKHTDLYCSACHHTKHRYVPNCRECHQPHIPEMTQSDCLTCHSPHKALEVEYPQDTPRKTCAICHEGVYKMLVNSGTKHAAFKCTFCHPVKHRTIKRCPECHGEPHDESIHTGTNVCGNCHGIAHNVKI